MALEGDKEPGFSGETVKGSKDPIDTLPNVDAAHESSPKKETTVSTSSSISPSVDGDELRDNPFADPDVAAYYATLYEKAQYECRHVFDPKLQWTREEERRLVRKLDWHVCLWAVRLT